MNAADLDCHAQTFYYIALASDRQFSLVISPILMELSDSPLE